LHLNISVEPAKVSMTGIEQFPVNSKKERNVNTQCTGRKSVGVGTLANAVEVCWLL